MAFQSIWYFTNLPENVVDLIEKDVFDNVDSEDSKNVCVSPQHWVSGFLWHYIQRANRENFLYNLTGIDEVQYVTQSMGHYDRWHVDDVRHGGEDKPDLTRKVSCILQLSDVDDYEGGNVEVMSDAEKRYFVPRSRGVVVMFDARSEYRILKVRKGTRKSLITHGVGPSWK
tara:strand:+ start:3876 stop:4388 length:513 start_codon:yes stop_codon:yes gene_type:complete